MTETAGGNIGMMFLIACHDWVDIVTDTQSCVMGHKETTVDTSCGE